MASRRPKTIPSHTYKRTSNPNIFRFIDRRGDWTHYWIKSEKIFVPAVNHIIRTGYPKGERFYQYLLHANPAEAEKKLLTAGEEGTRTHSAIRDLIWGKTVSLETKYPNDLTGKWESLSPEEWHNIEAFAAWCSKYDPHVLLSEEPIWSRAHGYAGTIDFVGTIQVPPDDKAFPTEVRGTRILILIDWKTSSGIWEEYELQTAAYRTAALVCHDDILPIKEYGGLWTGVVRLGTAHKQGFEMKGWSPEESEGNFYLFAAAYAIYVRKFGPEFVSELKNIPAEFTIKMPPIKPPKNERARTKNKKKS
ncbi:MAG: 1, phiSA1p24 [Candidatus Parcubacteria bacterium]|nr:1, phiSA1p24 [Candidatus Parcubacteria bacterium]